MAQIKTHVPQGTILGLSSS